MYRSREILYSPTKNRGVTQRELEKTLPYEAAKAAAACDWRALANQLRNDGEVVVRLEVVLRVEA